EHATLGKSPIANALTLVKALERDVKIHLLTHSRGGLVADVLAQVCANPTDRFKNIEARDDLENLKEIASLVRKRNISVERVVRVACPARGTLLASKRLDAYLSVFKWTLELAGIPVLPAILDFINGVAERR